MNTIQKPASGSINDDLAPVRIVNALPDVDDGQTNTLHIDELANGLVIELSEWAEMLGPILVYYRIDQSAFGGGDILEPGFGKAEFVIPLDPANYTHGGHRVEYFIQSLDDANKQYGPLTAFFIDLLDPNLGQQPAPPILPGDMADGIITPEYLDTHGGVTFTLPPPRSAQPGDTYSFQVGESEVFTDLPAEAPFEVKVSREVFDALGRGSYPISYSLMDRAGNRTEQSLATEVFLDKFDISPPLIPQGPEITLRDAQDGVMVFVRYASPAPGDFVTVNWHGAHQDSIHYPLDYAIVRYADIARPGMVYTGQVTYELNRNGEIHESAATTVFVNLNAQGH